MADELKFFGWERSGVYALATGNLQDGRMAAQLPLTIADRDNPANDSTQNAEFLIAGPKDAGGLRKSAIGKRYPSNGTVTAATTKLAYVELKAPDLPWRYTPQAANVDVLRPSIVLVVGA